MTRYRLRYRPGARYAHLNRAAFPRRYETREEAEAERDRVLASQTPRRDDIEVVDAENPHEIRGNAPSEWDNGGHNKAAPGGASTPLIQGPRRLAKESTDG